MSNIYGNICRPYYKIPGMNVSEDGKHVYRYYGNDRSALLKSRPPKSMSITSDYKGNSIVRTKDHGVLRLDEMVLRCFKGNPHFGMARIRHIDGDKNNCHKSNLEWMTIKEWNEEHHMNDDWKELFGEDDDVQINVKTREVRQKGKILTPHDSIYDTDTDKEVKVQEFVIIRIKNGYGKIEDTRQNIDILINAVS